MNTLTVKPLIIYPMDPVGNKIGGIQTFLKNFIKYAPDDFEIEFVGVTSDKKNRPTGKWQEIIVYRKKINFLPILYVKDENIRTKIPLSFKFALPLFKYKKQLNCKDKILMYNRIEPSLPFTNIPGKKILVIHNNTTDLLYSPYSELKWRKFPSLYFQMEKRLISKMDKVFVVREDVVEFYQKRYTFMADRFSFLPTWVDEETFFPYRDEVKSKHKVAFSKNKSFPVSAKLILFVGRLEGQKDPLLLIDAFYYINEHIPETRLLIVGKGGLRKKMEDRIEQYGLKERIVFLGILPQDKVAELMKISDVFLLTSAFEGMPRSVLEALACGLPVVTADVGEVKRVVHDGFSGLTCSHRNAGAISEVVLKVFKNGRQFSSENCLSSIRDYTARRVLNKVYRAYYDLGRKQ